MQDDVAEDRAEAEAAAKAEGKTPRVSIVCDGTPMGTKVLVDGLEIPFIKDIRLAIDANGCEVTVTMYDVELKFDGSVYLNVQKLGEAK